VFFQARVSVNNVGHQEFLSVTHKQPYRITLKTGEPFAMAGIYAREPTGARRPDIPPRTPKAFAS
jgi:putative SOS response-associated peptidase YedK